MTTYHEKLKDPRWQKKRLEVLERDDWMCCICVDDRKTLHVHHRYYDSGKNPWDYPIEALATLCEDCHKWESDLWDGKIKALSEILKRHFLSDSLDSVVDVFDGVSFHYDQVWLMDAIKFLLGWEDTQKRVINLYDIARKEDRY